MSFVQLRSSYIFWSMRLTSTLVVQNDRLTSSGFRIRFCDGRRASVIRVVLRQSSYSPVSSGPAVLDIVDAGFAVRADVESFGVSDMERDPMVSDLSIPVALTRRSSSGFLFLTFFGVTQRADDFRSRMKLEAWRDFGPLRVLVGLRSIMGDDVFADLVRRLWLPTRLPKFCRAPCDGTGDSAKLQVALRRSRRLQRDRAGGVARAR